MRNTRPGFNTHQQPVGPVSSPFVVQPILISSQSPSLTTTGRAPPSLIPISSFSQQRIQARPRQFQLAHSQFIPGELEVEELEDDEGEEVDWNEATEELSGYPGLKIFNTDVPHSTSSLRTGGLSGTGLRGQEFRHEASKSTILNSREGTSLEAALYEEDDEEDEPPSMSISKNSNLSSILSAIRNNTSLTIEEVPLSPTISNQDERRKRVDYHGILTGEQQSTIDTGNVEVFTLPQQIPPSTLRKIEPSDVVPKRGRPRRQPISDVMSSPDMSTMSGRRTQRDRRPTTYFTPDISQFRGRRKRGHDNNDGNKTEISESSPVQVSASDEIVSDGNSETFSPPRRRGRQSTGRSRGRPRGSTNRPKEVTDDKTAETSETDDQNSATGFTKPSTPGSEVSSTSIKRTIPGKSGRGGARGGRRMTKAQKLQKAKLKKLLSNRKDSLQIFEEETRMSAADVKPSSNVQVAITAGDGEDASNSTSTTTSTTAKSKKQNKADIEERRPVTATTLFEYHWPVDDPLAEIFFLQEQLSDYLGVKSFKRKYPDLKRRAVEMGERDFLREKKIVSEMQCDLGLTALYSNEVLEIMFKDFPDKYEEYRHVVQERRDKEYMKQKTPQTTAPPIRDKGAEFMRRILNSASTWNMKLNRQRMDDRSCAFDLQTNTLNVQRSKMRFLPPNSTKIGYYPLAVLPGQYTDGFKKYSSDELKYLPLNTVSFGPVIRNRLERCGSDDSLSDSDDSTSTDSSSSSDSDDKNDSASDVEDGNSRRKKRGDHGEGTTRVTSIAGEIGGEAVTCRTCEGDVKKNKDGQQEVLIQCTKCNIANHPSCLELSLDMLPFIKKYNWHCTDCKNCIECNEAADEDKMLFCDLCDRGYHIYCVGLRKVPTGRWHCHICSVCYSCGARTPTNDDRPVDWHHEFKKGEKGAKFYMYSLCVACHRQYKKGQFCPVCSKSHLQFDEKLLIECRGCEKWVHRDCIKRPIQTILGFMCDSCDTTFKSKTKIASNV